jgi:hypothetical protein
MNQALIFEPTKSTNLYKQAIDKQREQAIQKATAAAGERVGDEYKQYYNKGFYTP